MINKINLRNKYVQCMNMNNFIYMKNITKEKINDINANKHAYDK